jgi:hypothetical protein
MLTSLASLLASTLNMECNMLKFTSTSTCQHYLLLVSPTPRTKHSSHTMLQTKIFNVLTLLQAGAHNMPLLFKLGSRLQDWRELVSPTRILQQGMFISFEHCD